MLVNVGMKLSLEEVCKFKNLSYITVREEFFFLKSFLYLYLVIFFTCGRYFLPVTTAAPPNQSLYLQ